ncbi:universal stress protein [Flavobacterium sp. LHD-85]|uniref:universal stress protein n=1 Tax=Flavobacterium sp. LHD-85 TaxID=3071410 RepID=UPI0027DF8EF9|nr:universal stress protein [Flavobacterium sp. LHD-85]MDQ6530975.1 universal stress protein [Flavobacterium sp. LHD-85]
MPSLHTILAATDFSVIATNAVTYACGLAKATGSKLILLHAFSLSVHSSNSRISSQGMQQELDLITKRLKNLGSDLSKLYEIEVDIFCAYLPLEEELFMLIEAHKPELVVMGMAEKSLEQDLLGNSTTSVIKNIIIPVLAVPQNARFNNAKKILFAFDNFSLSSAERVSWFTRMAENLNAEVEFFSVDERVVEMLRKPNKIETIEELGFEAKFVYKNLDSSTVLSEIKKEIRNYNADILVMMPQKYGFWDSMIHISKTRSMATGLDIPLLSLPNY